MNRIFLSMSIGVAAVAVIFQVYGTPITSKVLIVADLKGRDERSHCVRLHLP